MNILSSLQTQLHPSAWIIIILIFVIFICAITINLLIRKKYSEIESDLNDKVQKRRGIYSSEVLNRIITDYKSASFGNYNEVNTQAIIEKCFNSELKSLNMGERFIKNSVSLLIVLGLLGTFLGLTMSVGTLVQLLGDSGNTEIMNSFSSIVDGLLSSVSGMAVAFLTSLFGIGTSIILTVLNIIVNVEEARENLMVSIEEYLDNTVSLVVAKDKETEFTMMNKILRQTFEEFGTKIENSLKSTVESFGEKLTNVGMEVELSSKTLDTTVERFDSSLKNFAENIRDFSEFNFNLRNNIERMDTSFVKVTEAINDTSNIIQTNYNTLDEFSNNIKTAASEITTYNKQVVGELASLVDEVKVSVTSVNTLAQSINDEMNSRIEEIASYRGKMEELIDKTGAELKNIGQQTALSFKNTVDENGKQMYESLIGNIKDVSGELFNIIREFEQNEKIFAKTIAMLPEQVLAYNKSSVEKTDNKIEELKEIVTKL